MKRDKVRSNGGFLVEGISSKVWSSVWFDFVGERSGFKASMVLITQRREELSAICDRWGEEERRSRRKLN